MPPSINFSAPFEGPCQPLSDNHESQTLKEVDSSTHIYLRNLAHLVSSRLPKGLPPYSADPSFFATGLLYFMPILTAIKDAWLSLSHSDDGDDISPDTSPQLSGILAVIEPLMRTVIACEHDMRIDISDLSGWDDVDLDRELAAMAASNAFLADILAHLSSTASSHPHALLGYCYTILSILLLTSEQLRPKLTAPPPEFWRKRCSALRPLTQNLGSRRTGSVRAHPIFAACMASEKVAERQAQVFAMLRAADAVLSREAVNEVAEEARFMAQSLVKVVQELDMICWDMAPGDARAAALRGTSSLGPDGKRKGHPRRAARDSVQLTRERKWCTTGLDELGQRMRYDLQADSDADQAGDAESAVPRIDALEREPASGSVSPTGLMTATPAGERTTSPKRARLIKFDTAMPRRDS